jgi:hypothetical protein
MAYQQAPTILTVDLDTGTIVDQDGNCLDDVPAMIRVRRAGKLVQLAQAELERSLIKSVAGKALWQRYSLRELADVAGISHTKVKRILDKAAEFIDPTSGADR